jgi:hypothetical protein
MGGRDIQNFEIGRKPISNPKSEISEIVNWTRIAPEGALTEHARLGSPI